MRCPIDGQELAITERQGIEIDYCPKCRGVWLDRGELDKLIERTNQMLPSEAPPPRRYQDDKRSGEHEHGSYGHKKRKKSLLGELFDF